MSTRTPPPAAADDTPGNLEEALVRLRRVLAAARNGDLTVRCGRLPGELDVLGETLDATLEALASHVGRVGSASAEVVAAAEAIDHASRTLAASASRQAAAVAEIARKLQALGSRSEEIGQIVETLDDVAAETNIIALNAAIEASRAGTSGKGFGMVADEVRKLAERSAAATKDIGAFIQTLEGTTNDASRAVDGLRTLSDGVTTAAGETVRAAAELAGSARTLSQAMARLRVPGQVEAELRAALRQRGSELQQALDGLAPLLDDAAVARTPLGDALRRLLEELREPARAGSGRVAVDGGGAGAGGAARGEPAPEAAEAVRSGR
jgi:methyl-accepting chemotaxis protein